MTPLTLANVGWPGSFMAFGFVASQIVGLGLLFEWVVVWKRLRLAPGRAAIATLSMNLASALVGVPLTYTLGGAVGHNGTDAFVFLVLAAVLSAAVEALVLMSWFGVAASNRAFAWLAGANVLSCVIVTMVFLIGR